MKNKKTARAGIIDTGFVARFQKLIRPPAVTARAQLEGIVDAGHLCADSSNIEFSMVAVIFRDNIIANVFALEIVLGGGCAECHYSSPE